ncbi:MAG: hypothetical protein ACKO96_13585, partial [Flammeovirgaceae bacterium]
RQRNWGRTLVPQIGHNGWLVAGGQLENFVLSTVIKINKEVHTSMTRSPAHLPIIVNVPLTTVTVVIMGFIIAGLIVGISWLFTKTFSFTRLVKIATIVCVVWTISSILSTMLNLGGQ